MTLPTSCLRKLFRGIDNTPVLVFPFVVGIPKRHPLEVVKEEQHAFFWQAKSFGQIRTMKLREKIQLPAFWIDWPLDASGQIGIAPQLALVFSQRLNNLDSGA